MLTVNGEAIADTEIREEAASLRPKYYEAMGEGDPVALEIQLRDWSRENVIERVLLRQEAAAQGLEVATLLDRVRAMVAAPGSKEVGDFYKKHKDTMWVPELVLASHIVKLVDDTHPEAEALQALQAAETELAAGAEFAELATRTSDDTVPEGSLGWFARGKMVPEFDAVVFAMRVGEVSPIFRTSFGFHLVQLRDRKPEGIPGLPLVKEQLAARLLQAKQDLAVEAFVDKLRERAVVTR